MTIIISSHLLAEVEKMVSHVGIIVKGKLIFQGTLTDLHLFQQKASRLFINTSDNQIAYNLLKDHSPEKNEEMVSVAFQDINQVADINRRLTRQGLDVYLLHPKQTDLEQLFIDLTTSQS